MLILRIIPVFLCIFLYLSVYCFTNVCSCRRVQKDENRQLDSLSVATGQIAQVVVAKLNPVQVHHRIAEG